MRLALALSISLCCAFAQPPSAVRPVKLRCEYRTNPAGLDTAKPRLSWQLSVPDAKRRGVRQTAYQVVVASSAERLAATQGDLWDTGKVESSQSIQLEYAGAGLKSGMQAFWKVRAWDETGAPSHWSEPAAWSMGLMSQSDWKAQWIGRDEAGLYKNPNSPFHSLTTAKWIWQGSELGTAGASKYVNQESERYFRTSFTLPSGREVKKATAVMGCTGQCDLELNGNLVGQSREAIFPYVFYLTEWLQPGANGVLIKTRYKGKAQPGLIAAFRIEFVSGEPMLVTTSDQWTVSAGGKGGADATWVVGPYGAKPWEDAGFIEERALPARMLRKEFTLRGPVKRAVAYVSGLGLSELYVNGAKAGDHVLSPNLTDYDKRVFYVTHDVTKMVNQGRNAVGIWLGNGRYWGPRSRVAIEARSFGYPKLRMQLEVTYADGTTEIVASDDSWKLTTQGPIRANNEFDGEEYDARLEMAGWAKPGFDDSRWETAQPVAGPSGIMAAQNAEPLKVIETLKPVKVSEPKKGVYVFDLGQNMVGWVQLRVKGAKGTEVTLRHAESLRPDGMLYVDNLRSARAEDRYTLKGSGTEVWEPRFTYHGFRYVEVRGYPGVPTTAAIEGKVVHDSMTRIADWRSSNMLLNRIHTNILWGMKGNYRSIPTDCPQRDERQGWLGDRSVAALYAKFTTDIADSQKESGSIPVVVPAYWVLYMDDVTWPSTFLLAPKMLHDQYGDTRVIQEHYPHFKRWIEHMRKYMKDGLMPRDTFGDWCVPPESPELIHSQDPARKTNGTLIGTAYFYRMVQLMVRYAKIAGQEADAAEYEKLAAAMRIAFHNQFYKADLNQYDNGTQTSAILPLAFGMAPENVRSALFDKLAGKIESESKGHVGVGLIGAQWLMRTVTGGGRPDLAYKMATQKTYPGWGYMIDKGATTIWELWNGDTADPAMNSGNHVMQIGDLGVWLYENLAGIQSDENQPGFRHIVMKPTPAGDLTFVQATHESPYGLIASHWRKEPTRFAWDVTVPPNTTATVFVPAKDTAAVMESGALARQAKGVKPVRTENGFAVFEVQPGTYSFVAPN
jgi:alpha-L-rhamnosidase